MVGAVVDSAVGDEVVGGTVAGAVVEAVVGATVGAVVGAVVGAAVGAAHADSTRRLIIKMAAVPNKDFEITDLRIFYSFSKKTKSLVLAKICNLRSVHFLVDDCYSFTSVEIIVLVTMDHSSDIQLHKIRVEAYMTKDHWLVVLFVNGRANVQHRSSAI